MNISQQALDALYPSMAPPSTMAPQPATPTTPPAERDAVAVLYGTPSPPGTIPNQALTTAPATPDTATLLYDTPTDGVMYGEPALDRIEAVPINLPEDIAGQLGPDELPQVRAAFVAAGVGHTLAGSFVEQATAAMRSPITTTPEQAHAALRQKYGARADAKIAAAHALIEQAAVKWPQVWDFLDRSGLGNSPRLIEQLAARAARRSGT